MADLTDEDYDDYWFHQRYDDALAAQVGEMRSPVRCTKCSKVYVLGEVKVIARYADCSVWKCPGCGCTVDDRPPGWGDHHYVELDATGREKRNG
jgi:hypothetical protein